MDGYIIELVKQEKIELVTNCDRFEILKHSTVLPKAFTEKGLYMLATILKSPRATMTTIAIVETFAKVREATRSVAELLDTGDSTPHAENLQHNIGNLMTEILTPNIDDYDIETVKTSAKVKFFSLLEFSKEVVRKPKKK
ncbi:MAG: ORF6N domain-containing protein [Burkholderiales bacterium]|nr:ORF6N domain-containing protein [Burkholderiales bacterium]